MAGARDARAAELLNEADPARSARGCAAPCPTAPQSHRKGAAAWGERLISRPVRGQGMLWKQMVTYR